MDFASALVNVTGPVARIIVICFGRLGGGGEIAALREGEQGEHDARLGQEAPASGRVEDLVVAIVGRMFGHGSTHLSLMGAMQARYGRNRLSVGDRIARRPRRGRASRW